MDQVHFLQSSFVFVNVIVDNFFKSFRKEESFILGSSNIFFQYGSGVWCFFDLFLYRVRFLGSLDSIFCKSFVSPISKLAFTCSIPFLFLIESSSFHLLQGCVGEKVKNNMFVAGRRNQ